MKNWIIGVDEVGRGPLAGPVAVGAVLVPKTFNWKLLPKVGDSKLLTEREREEIYGTSSALNQRGILSYRVSMVSAKIIDRIGISAAITQALKRAIMGFDVSPNQVIIKLDGLLCAPSQYKNQETIIKGDQKVKEIGLASVIAKVRRDQYMRRKAKYYPMYGFERHKGYGTRAHHRELLKYGPCRLHRLTYIHML